MWRRARRRRMERKQAIAEAIWRERQLWLEDHEAKRTVADVQWAYRSAAQDERQKLRDRNWALRGRYFDRLDPTGGGA